MSRDRWVCMMRVRNEARWIRRSLERTFEVCKTVVIFDDGSDDETLLECGKAVEGDSHIPDWIGATTWLKSPDGSKCVHILESPFRPSVREKEVVNEIRDKNFLWYYVKAQVDFDHVLCLDGDEMLSLEALRQWDYINRACNDGVDVITIPFVYLWDREDQARVDGIYGNNSDGHARLRFPRIFSVKRCDPQTIFDMHFSWEGTKGGFHCGSIPRTRFVTTSGSINGHFVPAPVVHFGYLDDVMRRRKFEFYNKIDPGNMVEGEYKHIIGEPDLHAPGPVKLVDWKDQ